MDFLCLTKAPVIFGLTDIDVQQLIDSPCRRAVEDLANFGYSIYKKNP